MAAPRHLMPCCDALRLAVSDRRAAAGRRTFILRFLSKVLGTYAALPLALVWAAPNSQPTATATQKGQKAMREVMVEPIYSGGLKGRWQDYGWAPRDTGVGTAARLNFADLAGWILVHRGPVAPATALTFRVRAPASFGDFLEVRLGSANDDVFPHVVIDSKHARPINDVIDEKTGWLDVHVPYTELNPKQIIFDRIVLRARRPVNETWVELAQLGFVSLVEDAGANTFATYDSRRVSLQVNCGRATRPISPLVYGIAFNPRKNQSDAYQFKLGASVRRWGGNPASRYNWRLGNAWNTAVDWFFLNVNYTSISNYSWSQFFDENKSNNLTAALTVPMLGWVAKDTRSYSYPVSVYGQQRGHFGQGGDVGNGIGADGKMLGGADPKRTSIMASPEFVGDWVDAIKRYDEDAGQKSVSMYFLDNEPTLWNSTHHDVHPDPVGYDELLRRSIDYATEVRRADPEAVIAGPAAWGWPAYFFSGKDQAAGFDKKPDRLAHDDMPLLAWYLREMQRHAQTSGDTLLNVLDVHYYPEGDGIHGGHERFDDAIAAKRIRATRSLWDPTYKDESWIAERIRLIPRLKELIAENYPGTQLSLGEYNFGGDTHISGALAEAEALGRFGQTGVNAAFYWTYPPENSPVYHAFRAFRNYDGQGGRFMDRSVHTVEDSATSLFASIDEAKQRMVLVALNLDLHDGADTDIDFAGCKDVAAGRVFQYGGNGQDGLHKILDRIPSDAQSDVRTVLPPASITVFEVDFAKSGG